MNYETLVSEIRNKQSFLCTGLDTEINKLPPHFTKDLESVLTFNTAIIKSTSQYSVAYKINTAFYEQYGAAGWAIMEETLKQIPKNTFTIADAKRGDIGNTSSMYAKAFFETLNFDAITVSPYMGEDSLRPFLEFKNKWVICLALTSNAGHADFQKQELNTGKKLYETVIETVCKYGNEQNLMFVVGATQGHILKSIRSLIPNHFLLVPGVGAQGGDLNEVASCGLNSNVGLLVNSSRNILYASSGTDFAEAAENEAKNLALTMQGFLN